MQVEEIMTCTVETIGSGANLVEAARKMRSLEVGALPVWENDKLIGMITDRDIAIRGVADERDPSSTSVEEIMTSDVCSCFEDANIYEAANMMEERSIHRLLVVNGIMTPLVLSRCPILPERVTVNI